MHKHVCLAWNFPNDVAVLFPRYVGLSSAHFGEAWETWRGQLCQHEPWVSVWAEGNPLYYHQLPYCSVPRSNLCRHCLQTPRSLT